jgi:hypothetical protein
MVHDERREGEGRFDVVFEELVEEPPAGESAGTVDPAERASSRSWSGLFSRRPEVPLNRSSSPTKSMRENPAANSRAAAWAAGTSGRSEAARAASRW